MSTLQAFLLGLMTAYMPAFVFLAVTLTSHREREDRVRER
jgi:hypothetical protein